jgi:hypothetical protein
VLDQVKIRLTQPEVELELGLSLATQTNPGRCPHPNVKMIE